MEPVIRILTTLSLSPIETLFEGGVFSQTRHLKVESHFCDNPEVPMYQVKNRRKITNIVFSSKLFSAGLAKFI